jgi:hypothetical protein
VLGRNQCLGGEAYISERMGRVLAGEASARGRRQYKGKKIMPIEQPVPGRDESSGKGATACERKQCRGEERGASAWRGRQCRGEEPVSGEVPMLEK